MATSNIFLIYSQNGASLTLEPSQSKLRVKRYGHRKKIIQSAKLNCPGKKIKQQADSIRTGPKQKRAQDNKRRPRALLSYWADPTVQQTNKKGKKELTERAKPNSQGRATYSEGAPGAKYSATGARGAGL